MRGTAEAPTRRDVRRDGKFPFPNSSICPIPGIPYYLHRTGRGQVGTHTILPQYL